jgi:DNA-binding NarL/FixJ family response regulator
MEHPGWGRTVRVAVIDDHEAIRNGLAHHLVQSPDLLFDGAFADIDALLATGRVPDVIVLDLYLDGSEQTTIPQIGRLRDWGAQVLVHTYIEAPVLLRDAVAAGAAGVCLKSDGLPAIVEAVRQVAAGEPAYSSAVAAALVTDAKRVARLSPREVETLVGLDDGLDYQQIARLWGISVETVKGYMRSVRAKYAEREAQPAPMTIPGVLRRARADGYIGRPA